MAGSDYFLKLDGIKGETGDSKMADAIDILSWSWGEVNGAAVGQGGGLGAGKVSMNDVTVMLKMNKAAPALLKACATGQHIAKAEVIARRAGGKQEEFLKIALEQVLVSSYQETGSGGFDPVPSITISLNFAKFKMEYKEQAAAGSASAPITASYDRITNKSS